MTSDLLPNAPLSVVLAQVQHSPVAKIADYVGDLQDRLRKGAKYPEFLEKRAKTLDLRLGPNGEISQVAKDVLSWEFASADRGKIVIVNGDAVTFMVAGRAYEGSDSFLSDFGELVKLVFDVVEIDFVRRIGIRYLDHIKPLEEGVGIFEYFSKSFAPYSKDGLSLNRHSFRTEYGIENGGTAAVAFRHGKGETVITPDLSSVSLDVDYKERLNDDEATLDTDVWKAFSPPMKYDQGNVFSVSKELRRVAKDIFLDVASTEAMQRWRGKR